MKVHFVHALALAAVLLLPILRLHEWLTEPTPGIPRTPDGKPNLAAPAPRMPDGKPDHSNAFSRHRSLRSANRGTSRIDASMDGRRRLQGVDRTNTFPSESLKTAAVPQSDF